MQHDFAVTLRWRPTPPAEREIGGDYSHEAVVHADEHAYLVTSAAAGFGGDARLWNPEELLMAAVSQCHMLSFLYAAHRAGVAVSDYKDEVTASMTYQGGSGSMDRVTLNLRIATDASVDEVDRLHDEAKVMCVMRASIKCPVDIVSVLEPLGTDLD